MQDLVKDKLIRLSWQFFLQTRQYIIIVHQRLNMVAEFAINMLQCSLHNVPTLFNDSILYYAVADLEI